MSFSHAIDVRFLPRGIIDRRLQAQQRIITADLAVARDIRDAAARFAAELAQADFQTQEPVELDGLHAIIRQVAMLDLDAYRREIDVMAGDLAREGDGHE